ncbi:glycoside hydrolase family 15 protein [Polymorphospora sp. NPDC050346]|uniref:glycoside hydrolase family 15 protein n=1 Tax=Polymorphospora sp. NPDC050346 TaxID=3155780 RepID=UPI0033C3FCA5
MDDHAAQAGDPARREDRAAARHTPGGDVSDAFPPIDSYAFLSDTHTAALVAPDGAVEWFCVPRFDGDAVFARLLDRRAGGAFELRVDGADAPDRRYLPDTLVLQTRHTAPDGVAVGHDFLAAATGHPDRPVRARHVLVRHVSVESGTVRLRVRLDVRADHGARPAGWQRHGDRWRAAGTPLWLSTDLPLRADGTTLTADLELTAGDGATLLLGYGEPPAPADVASLLDETVGTWRDWSARSDYAGYGADLVRHSALVLRGLSFDRTGALLAAPTTSLPEEIGGVRNWDYRYTWHRDAALLLLALFRLGHHEEGGRYLRFLIDVCQAPAGTLHPLVGIGGETTSDDERILAHLDGYAGSRPVRVGNGAAEQVQFDTYGHVLDAALAFHELTGDLAADQWGSLRRHVETIARRWREPDHGVWEIRAPRQQYVYSKVMSWVCLDRGIRLAGLLGDATAPVDAWRREAADLHAQVLDRGYDPQVGGFVLAYGSTELDAALLRIPLVGFLPGDDPRMLSTIDRIQERLAIGPGLVRRYTADDGLPGEEGAFLLCCFELVSALVLAHRHDAAREIFERLAGAAGPLGLYAEQLAADGTALGNYPQAFTHLALIEAAVNLDAAQERDALHAWAERGGRRG